MAFNKNTPLFGYELVREGNQQVMRINYESYPITPSIEEDPNCMARTIDSLSKTPNVSRVILSQRRNYVYNFEQTQMLAEIARLYNSLIRDRKMFNLSNLGLGFMPEDYGRRHGILQHVILNLLKTDPIGAYVEVKRFLREEKIKQKKITGNNKQDLDVFIDALTHIERLLENTRLIRSVEDNVHGFQLGDRTLYTTIFRPAITPDFIFTRLMAQHPVNAEELDIYRVDGNEVVIYRVPENVTNLYHITPPEFRISEDKYALIDLARSVLAEHQPREEEFLDPERMRTTFFNIGRDLLLELAQTRDVELSSEEINELTNILIKYTIGFGPIEDLLADERIQDVVVNSPIGETPIYVLHQDYDECLTNIIPSRTDSESWASKFRLLSGRPLDEANPVLDTELILPKARARVAIVQKPLNPFGIAYSLRRHRDRPWTFPLFIKNRMINPLAAGLMSFLVDGGRSMLFAGTRSSGKTSLMGAMMLEIMRRYRIISIEDSVTGDSEIIIKRNGKFERTTIGKLIDGQIEKFGYWYNLSGHEVLGNSEKVEVLSMNKKGKIELARVSKFIRHKVNKDIYEITTRTGRKIKVTGDHSLFGIDEEAKISEVSARLLKEKDFIAVPRKLPLNTVNINKLNLLDYLDKFDKGYLVGKTLRDFLNNHRELVYKLGKEYNYNRSLRNYWIRKGVIPLAIFRDIYSLGYHIRNTKDLQFKISHNSASIPVEIKLDESLLALVGLWIADGCYDKSSIILSVMEEENRDIAYNVAKKFGFNVKMHSNKFSLMLNSTTFKAFMRDVLELKGDAYTKRIPQWILNLSKKQIMGVLKGIFSGDGCVSDKEIAIPLSSLNLLKDLQTLLLSFGIILRIGPLRKDKTYNASISALKSISLFREQIGILVESKREKLDLLCEKTSTHDSTDIIPLSQSLKEKLKEGYSGFDYRNYINHQQSNFGRNHFGKLMSQISIQLSDNLRNLAESDLLWDQIREIKVHKINDEFVYDLSVPENESFIVDNVVAHNTLELNTEVMRGLGFNIQSMKVRSALTKGGTEVPADEGIRTSLRMGDSSLIIGEIRSTEAFALYEAMRIGALANVVAGTIHGDSPYGVFDRVVNDLKVPRTSFKATDVIVISNPIKSPSGLQKWRRVLSITEVRKDWEDDPVKERGFVDLMKYNPKTDEIEVTDDLINGDSEILKSIAGNVKEWAGNWDAVWDNITLRADVKKTLFNYAEKLSNYELLEAPFVVRSNDMFHQISQDVRDEVGSLDSKRILFDWEEWLKRKVKNI